MAEITTLARPYAKAAFDAANEAGQLDGWANALGTVAVIAGDPRVLPLLGDPQLTAEDLQVLMAVENGPDGFDNFIALLIDNDRLPLLPEVAALFAQLKADAESSLTVTVRAATKLDSKYRKALIERLGKRFGKTVELEVQVDEALLGGAIIEAGDLVIDGSLRSKIARLGEAIVN